MYTRREALGSMGKFVLVASTINITNLLAQEMDFRVVPASKAKIIQEGKAAMFCPVCGMNLPMYYRTNHASEHEGKIHQYCSIHCMSEEAMVANTAIKNPQVIDNDTLTFIPAKSAYYVVGSKKPGTMSAVSKYAFGKQESAKAFAKEFGGELMRYDALASKVALGLKSEIAMIQQRQRKGAAMGEKIYAKVCKQNPQRFTSIAEAKVYLQESKICGNLKGKEFQQVAMFLAGK